MQFSLRTILIAISLLCILFTVASYVIQEKQKYEERREAAQLFLDLSIVAGSFRKENTPASMALRLAGVSSDFRIRVLQFEHPYLRDEHLAPLELFPELESLSISHAAGLSDKAFTLLPTFPELSYLRLTGNTHISREGWQKLVGSPKLTEIFLEKMDLQTCPLEMLSSSMEDLIIRGCYIDKKNCEAISRLVNLRYLSLYYSRIEDLKVIEWQRLSKLEKVDLSDCNISDRTVVELCKLPVLKTLFLSNTKITDESVKPLLQCKSLKRLSVSETVITPGGLKLLKSQFTGNDSLLQRK